MGTARDRRWGFPHRKRQARCIPAARRRREARIVHSPRSERQAMSPLERSNNIAARMGRWSAAHRKAAVFGWLAFVVAALALGHVVGTRQIDEQNANVGQSHRADQLLRDAGFQTDPQTEIVLVQSRTLTAQTSAFRAVVRDVVRTVRPFSTIENLRSPYAAGHGDQIAADGHSAMVEWDMKGDNK